MRRRGVAVATVLAGGMLLLIFCLLVASFCLTQLDFARNFRDHAQSEQLAQAALAQFIAQEAQLGLAGTPPSQRYHWQNLFGDDSQRLGGRVSLGFTPDRETGYHSLDNTQNVAPVASSLDTGDRTSVPPYSMQLLLKVETGGRVTWYEAIVQKRWPYALATREPMTFTNSVGGSRPGPPSEVHGKVLALPRADDSVVNSEPIMLNPNQYTGLTAQLSLRAEGGVTLGGPLGLSQFGGGNRLIGDAHFIRDPGNNDPPTVLVADGNTWQGSSRVIPGNSRLLIEEILATTSARPRTMVDPRIGTPVYLSGQQLFLMERDVVIEGHPPDIPPEDGAERVYGPEFYLDGSLGNSYFPSERSREEYQRVRYTKKSLTLRNTRLFVNGDLDLIGPRTDLANNNLPLLQGENATLVVYGTLRVDGGILDAVDQGMVIYCERLVMKVSGDYRGLITVRDSALFYPEVRDVPLEGGGFGKILLQFNLHGGLIIGGRRVLFQLDENERLYQDGDTPRVVPTPPATPRQDVFHGVCLFSTNLEYDPAYMTALHRFGDYQVLSLRRL